MAKPITITITRNADGEFRVPAPNGREAGAYYTDWRDDALDTAKHMYAKHGVVRFKIKRIND